MSYTTSGWERNRDLYIVLVQRQLKLRMKRSLLGAVWPVVSPFLLTVLYVFVFRVIFDVPIERYPDYLLCGLLPWAFLTQSVGRTIASVSTEADVIRKSRFAYELLPLSAASAHALNFLATMGLFIVYLGLSGNLHYGTLPMLVFPLVAVVLLVMSLAMIVSLIDVYSHDLNLVLGNILTIWFFLVPIVYRPSMLPEALEILNHIDPMNLSVTQMRAVLYYGQIQDPTRFLLMLLITGALFATSLGIFRRVAPQLPKDL